MDLQTTVTLVVIILLSIFLWLRSRYQTLSTFKALGIKGPRPSFLFGNIKEAWAEKKPWRVIDKWGKQYGKVYGCFPMGVRPILVISDTDILKEILIKDFTNFRNRPALGPPRAEPGASTLTTLRGERWKRVRNVISPTFTTKKIRQMSESMNKAASTFLTVLEGQAENEKPFNIYGMFQALTLDVIAQAAFALKVDSQTNPDDDLLMVCRGIFKSFFGPMLKLLLLFPEIGSAATFLRSRSGAANQEFYVITHMRNVLHERRRSPDTKGNDMIQLMMEATDHIQINPAQCKSVSPLGPSLPPLPPASVAQYQNNAKKMSSKYLTENELVANCFVFLLAGYETTANALAFTTFLLAKYPEIQESLYQDILENVGLKEEIIFDDNGGIGKLPYLDAVIKESLRLYPPITGFVMRECAESCYVHGLFIPAGMAIHIPVWTLHHDPDLWSDPETFCPDRFMGENLSKVPSMAFMPFGDGPRNCVGMSFAMMEIRITLVRMLQKYTFKETFQSESELELESPFVTMNPKNGVTVQLERRTLE